MPATTGDAQLDRVQQIDVGAIRDQRGGSPNSGMIEPRNPNAGPRVGAAEPPPPPAGMPAPDDKPKAKPVYKKWWFWAIVGVSAYVVYSIATEKSADPSTKRELPLGPKAAAPQPGGLTLLRW
jgi:hypothetical protein